MEAGEELLACLWFLCILVRFGSLRNLCGILQCIVKHRPHRHRIVNLRLVFNGQEKVGGMVVRHGNHHLRHIPESLHRNASTILPVRQGKQCIVLCDFPFSLQFGKCPPLFLLVVIAAHHDPARMQIVIHGLRLPQKLRANHLRCPITG